MTAAAGGALDWSRAVENGECTANLSPRRESSLWHTVIDALSLTPLHLWTQCSVPSPLCQTLAHLALPCQFTCSVVSDGTVSANVSLVRLSDDNLNTHEVCRSCDSWSLLFATLATLARTHNFKLATYVGCQVAIALARGSIPFALAMPAQWNRLEDTSGLQLGYS